MQLYVRIALLATVLGLSIATAVSCLNVLRKRDEEIDHAKAAAASTGITVDINTDALDHPGEALAAACFFTFIMALVYLVQPVITHFRRREIGKPWLWWLTMPVATVFLLGTAIATQIVAKNKSAKITAMLGKTVLPDALVQQRAGALGINPEYWSKAYVRQMAILAWPTFAVMLLLTIHTAVTGKKRSNAPTQNAPTPITSRESVEPKV